MAKARMLSTKAGSDPDLNSMSIEAELIFLLTIPHLDRDGLISGDPIPLWGKVAPRRVELMDKMPRIIGEWAEHNLVVRYAWKDGTILFFKGFRKHNINMAYEREPDSEYPPPPGFHRVKNVGLIPNDPEQAGRLAETIGDRSKYYAALVEASKQEQKDIDISLHVNDMQTTSKEHDEVEVEVKSKSNVSGREENTKTNVSVLVQFAAKMLLPEWNGGGVYLQSLSDEELVILSSWLWLHKTIKGGGNYARNDEARHYKVSPFAGIQNDVGFIRDKVGNRTPPLFYYAHRADFDAELRQFQAEHQP